MELTPRQADVVLFIRNFKHLYGHSPTYRELAEGLKIARGPAVAHVKALVKKGFLLHRPHTARTLEVREDVQGPEKPIDIPKRQRKDASAESGSPPS